MIPKSQPEPNRSRFSLVELIIIMTIIAILASIAVPRYASSIAHHRVEAAAMRILADLSFAQRQARISSASQTVTFNLALNEYSGSNGEVQLAQEPYGATITSANFGGDTDIIFDEYGIPDSGGSVIVQVADQQEMITVDAETGRATVE